MAWLCSPVSKLISLGQNDRCLHPATGISSKRKLPSRWCTFSVTSFLTSMPGSMTISYHCCVSKQTALGLDNLQNIASIASEPMSNLLCSSSSHSNLVTTVYKGERYPFGVNCHLKNSQICKMTWSYLENHYGWVNRNKHAMQNSKTIEYVSRLSLYKKNPRLLKRKLVRNSGQFLQSRVEMC